MSVLASGTQSATVTTEHTLVSSNSTAGSFVFMVDLNALVAGDTVELRIKRTVLSGGTERVIYLASYDGVQVEGGLSVVSVPFHNEQTFSVSLKQTYGTGRSFPWAVEKL